MNTATSLLGLLFDHTIGIILRMLAVIRLPKLERGPVSHGFVATLIVIMGYGLVMLFSARYSSGYANYGDVYHFIRPQGVIAVLGLVAMRIISNINYRALRYMNESFYIITVVLHIAALLSPEDTNGTYRWVYFAGGSFSLQPSELAKFSVMLWTADMLDRDHAHKTSIWYGLLKPALPLVPILILLKLEPHNSAILLLCAIFGTMILCNGSAMRWWPMVGAAGVAGVIAFLKHLASGDGYAAGRLGGVWGLTPTNTAGMQWQTLQSIYAICTGGLFGVGIGNSVQKHQWLPYAENDFIFAVIGEELGFVGALALIALFAALLVQGVCIALRAPDLYGTLLGIGIISQVGWQVFLHIGVGCCPTPASACRSSRPAAQVCCSCLARWALCSVSPARAMRGKSALPTSTAPRRSVYCSTAATAKPRCNCLHLCGRFLYTEANHACFNCCRRHCRSYQPGAGHRRRPEGGGPNGRDPLCGPA